MKRRKKSEINEKKKELVKLKISIVNIYTNMNDNKQTNKQNKQLEKTQTAETRWRQVFCIFFYTHSNHRIIIIFTVMTERERDIISFKLW